MPLKKPQPGASYAAAQEWPEIGGVAGPENEPAALVAWITVAQKEGAKMLLERMQKRLLFWERKHLSPEMYERIKDWPIYTKVAASAPEMGEYVRLRGLIEHRIANMATLVDGLLHDAAMAAHSELSDLLAAFDAGEDKSPAAEKQGKEGGCADLGN